MALSNRDRIARGMELLRVGLVPFAEREFLARLDAADWREYLADRYYYRRGPDGAILWDTGSLLQAIGDCWTQVFSRVLGATERAFIVELQAAHLHWASEDSISSDTTDRTLDTIKRILDAISASAEAEELLKLRADLNRAQVEKTRSRSRSQLSLSSVPKEGLKPWREVVTPHRDVSSGRYMQAEFAADLAQVHRDEGSDEYRDPAEFFRRTYITAGLRELLMGALFRLSGKGGDPVVELQTNFGGGKTHSMLALYHLFGGSPAGTLGDIDGLLEEAGLTAPPRANRAVLVGTDLSPAQIHRKPDGTEVHTLWGELAWQLGKAEGYALVADSDRRAVSPGAAVLGQLFRRFSPCLILIDEWVAYARQIVGKRDLPSGDFEVQASFAQALTEAAKASDRTIVVASIPASRIEIGGENGEFALDTLKNAFQRLGKAWRAATADEGFEIVRRRLFEPISDRESLAHRDNVIAAFARMYREAPGDYPVGCAEETYRRELECAYPIHPELFRRLYDEWSTLDKFQRTRGVLRLLAKVIHRLWESGDQCLMLLPSFVPLDDGPTRSELTRYLPDVWEPILSQDVDGENSLPLEIDRANPNLGRVSAARRVARTLYIGTAPGANKNPGIDDRRVRLGCVQPGETAAIFGDALRRLGDRAKYVHQDGNRYWMSTKANLNRMAEDRAAGFLREPEELHAEIEDRLKVEQDKHNRGDFAGVHPSPGSPSDVPDEANARLVILGPKYPHRKGQDLSPARTFAAEILISKGSGPRLERNCVVFLAADRKELDALLQAVAHYKAWRSIHDARLQLNLDPFHEGQAAKKLEEFDSTVKIRIASTWIHALIPAQENPTSEIRWDELKIGGNETALAKRTGIRLRQEDMLFVELTPESINKGDTLGRLGGPRLRMELDRYLWTDKDHVSFAQLAEWFARYLYLPRVKNRETLTRAIQHGLERLGLDDTFVVASGWDEEQRRYRGLTLEPRRDVAVDKNTLVIKLEVARHQQPEPPPAPLVLEPISTGVGDAPPRRRSTPPQGVPVVPGAPDKPKAPPNVFFGSVPLTSNRIGRDAARIAEEVLQHLTTLPGAEATISLEVCIRVPGGVKDDVVRTVTENARTLGFTNKDLFDTE